MILCIFPISNVYAAGDVDLVLENVSLDPLFPKDGQLVAITAEVYNAGIKSTDSFSSIITVGYFVDDSLIHVGTLENILPGIQNTVKISSPPLWESSSGLHDIEIILDYHDTLSDKIDSTENNSISETILVSPPIPTEILIDTSSQYFIEGEHALQITLFLINSDTQEPIPNQEIFLNFGDKLASLVTNNEGMTSFSNSISLFESLDVTANLHRR